MNSVRARVRSFMRGVQRPTQVDAEMDEEMRFHIDLEAQRLERGGLPRHEAQRRAAVAFGGVEKYKGAGRDARGITWVLGTSADFKLGVRMLAKHPGLTAVGVVALAVAIGGGAAYLEFVNDFFRPTLRGDAARIVAIQNVDATTGTVEQRALHDFAAWQRQVRSIEHLGAFARLDRNLITDDGRIDPVRGVEISASAFRVMPTSPLLGRPLVADDERMTAPPVAVIGEVLWQSRFGRDPAIVGKPLRLGERTHTIVGVMPESFAFPVNHSLWVPLQANGLDVPRREGPEIRVFGRLTAGTSIETAQAELDAIAAAARADAVDDHARQLRPRVRGYVDAFFDTNGDGPTQLLMLSLVNLFFIALLGVCGANVATLVFARTATRENEITVRTALGASRGRIVGQLFAEALVLSLVGAGVGLTLGSYGVGAGAGFLEQSLQQPAPFWWDRELSLGTILYGVALAVLAAAIIGIVPALKATGARMQTRLKQAGGSGSNLQFGGIWTGVIVGQVALTVVFLMTVVSLGWSAYFGRTAPVQFAFPRQEYVAARFHLDRATPSTQRTADRDYEARVQRVFRALEQRLIDEPGVKTLAYATALPGQKHDEFFIELDGVAPASDADPLWVRSAGVSADYFETFGASIVSGRGFTESDAEFGRPVAIVDQTFVATVLAGRDPVGLFVREPQHSENTTPGPWLEIIGVVRDLATAPARTSEDAVLYRPVRLHPGAQLAIHVKDPSGTFATRLRHLALDVDAGVRLEDVRRLDAADEADAVFYRFLIWALGVVGAVALLLSVAGVYALMAFTLARRTAEIGIRAALGAAPGRIVAAIFSRAFTQVGLGLLAGSVPGMAIVTLGAGEATRGAGVLMGIVAAVAIALFIVLVTTLACAGPTRRALRIQPTEALRADR